MATLGDYISIKHGYAFKGEFITSEDNGVVLVTPGNFEIGGGFKEKKCKFFSSDYPKEYVLKPGDLIVTMTDLSKMGDTLGYSAKIPFSNRIYLHNQRIGLVNIISNKLDKDYLYWYMRTPSYQKQVVATSSGSTVKHTSPTRICEIQVDFPPINEQKKVANFLNAIEDKINENDRINQNLEQQLQALFQAWFLDFTPFGGIPPCDWKYGKLKDILRLKRDPVKPGSNAELPYLPIDAIPMNSLAINELRSNEEAKSSLVKFDKDDIIIGAMRVYFHRVVLAPCDGITRTTCFTLIPYNKNYLSYALLCCNQNSSIDYAQKTSKGSTMPYAVWNGGLGDMEILIPSEKDASRFNDLVFPMLKKIQLSYFENVTLKDTRDSLLPKLMSGEIDVSKAEF